MIKEFIEIILLSMVPACFSYFLDFCLGHPMAPLPNTHAIFFSYSYFLAEQKLKRLNKLEQIHEEYKEQLQVSDPGTHHDALQQFRQSVIMEAQKYFTWEQAFGMCQFCANFWVALIFSNMLLQFGFRLSVMPTVIILFLIPIFSHTILRKI